MLTSLALIFLCGISLGGVFQKLRLPSLLGMIITGIILGPFTLGLIDASILSASADLRRLALVIILTKAGLTLDVADLKKVGRPAVLMCFLPACFEILATVLFAPMLLGLSVLEAAILGSVIAAVSPAVVVPRMIKLIETGYGTNKSIPQLVMAGASADDVFVIVLFTSFIALANGGEISVLSFIKIPFSILTGVTVGACLSKGLFIFFKKVHIRDSAKVIILLSIFFLLLEAEEMLADKIPFSSLISIMACGMGLLYFYPVLAGKLSNKFSKLWVAAEVLLFVLIGATVDISYTMAAGAKAVALLVSVLGLRMVGVWCCLLKTELTKKERLFCMIAYTPKATVQAAIGGIPLALGFSCGNIVLTAAVLSILITAPLGAFGIDVAYKKLLSHSRNKE